VSDRDAEACPCTMVVFGASGDLTRRKLMPALFKLERDGLLHDQFRVVGFARSEKSGPAFREQMAASIRSLAAAPPDEELLSRFVSRLHYVSGEYGSAGSLQDLRRKVADVAPGDCTRRELYYLALPPTAIETLLRSLKQASFIPPRGDEIRARIMVEKPFGRDWQSARTLNELLAELVDESQVYRIDHYLAKDTVRNLLVLRFTNAIFEPLWNRNHVDCVQITAAEDIGIEGRGSYYEEAGVVRDMIQNHVMQVLALVAMEPPLAGDSESVRDRKGEVFRSLAPLAEDDLVLGQYGGYRRERAVDPASVVPTFAAMRLYINNWRWHGVPFYIRSGKALPRKVTEVVVGFKSVPLCVIGDGKTCQDMESNVLVVRIQPDEGMRISFSTRLPGRDERVTRAHLDFRYADLGDAPSSGYELVILDGIEGRPSLFWRADGMEASWRAVDAMLKLQESTPSAAFPNYEPGTWGPDAAASLLSKDGRSWLSSY
jgi:glucose-6-phosphate 1-dehydrogenase